MISARSRHLSLSALLLPLSLAACASAGAGSTGSPGGSASASIADGASFTLRPGQSARLADDSRLRYLRVVHDARCPPDVQCVWAGDAVVAFQWMPSGGAAQAFELHTGLEPRSRAIGARTVVLRSLARGAEPEATLVVEAAR